MHARYTVEPAPFKSSSRWTFIERESKEKETLVKKPLRVLIVDDAPIERRVTQMFLEAIGHEATCAASSTGIVAENMRWDPDVVLMDVDGPGEVVQIQGLRSNTWLVLHSSRPRPELNALAERLGADGILEKTDDGAEFLERFYIAIGAAVPPSPPLPNPESSSIRSIPAPLRTGDKWIDAHHYLLFRTCTDYLARAVDDPIAETRVFLGFLERYASFHFAAEETLMVPGVPETTEHLSEHEAFLVYLRQMKALLTVGELPCQGVVRTHAFVKLWIGTHINLHDQLLMH